MGIEINFAGKYSCLEHVKRFLNPSYKNSQDLLTTTATLDRLNALTALQANKILEVDLQDALKNSQTLVKRLQKQWFVSHDVVATVKKIEDFLTTEKISKQQNIPFKLLAENHVFRKIIVANHLHHKITAQHQLIQCKITINEKGEPLFPVAQKTNAIAIIPSHKEETKMLTLEEFLTKFASHYDKETGKIKDLEFMANGLEIHSAKKWDTLRPSYELSQENGKYIHIDNLSGLKSEIGDVGKNYTQLVNVKPWGYNPAGGSLFGHTYVRFVIDGQLYHVGLNLQGEILNPDFLASIPMKGKKYEVSSWKPMEEEKDEYGYTQAERTLLKLEALQTKLKGGQIIESLPTTYAEEIEKGYEEVRFKEGGTCSSGATKFHNKFTEIKESTGRSTFNKVIFNSMTMKALDFVWDHTPSFIRKNIIQPIQIITRGKKPIFLELDGSNKL